MELRNVCSVLFLFLCCLSLINAQGPSPRNSPSNCDPNDPFLCPNRTIPDPSPTPFPKPDSPGPCIPDPFFPNGSVVVTLYKGNVLGWFQAGRAESVHLILVRGITGLLKAIDVRYSDGKLYGYADCNRIYTIDLVYGNASFVSQLNVPFNGSYSVGFEFVPNNDGFVRLVGNGGKNYLVELSTGNVAARTDRNLHYIKGDPQLRFGTQVLDAGYSFTEVAGSTAFYVINAAGNGSLAVIDPAGGSILSTVGILDAVPLGRRIGFDVAQYTDDSGNTAEIALMVSVNRYWTVDLSDGSTERIWRRSLLRKIPYNAWGLAIVAPQFVSTVLGELTANYISELYETAKVGNCTPCGSCPWDDRVVVLGDDSGGGSGGRRLTERAVEQVVNPGGYNGEDNNGGHHDEAVYNSAENEVIEDEGGNDSN